jgi:hypothetical protein
MQMDHTSELIESYVASGLLPSAVQAWYRNHQPTGKVLSAVGESIGAAFLAGRVDFTVANGLLNQLMVCVGFEAAPMRFWEYYVAFENHEISQNPTEDARPAVLAVANSGAA